jgi:hypothetical protein
MIKATGCTGLKRRNRGEIRYKKFSRQKMALSVDSSPLTGRALSAKQQQKENQRLQTLVSHPDEQRKLQQVEQQEGRTRGALIQDAA